MRYKYLVVVGLVVGIITGILYFLSSRGQENLLVKTQTANLSRTSNSLSTDQISQTAESMGLPPSKAVNVIQDPAVSVASWRTRTLSFQGKIVRYEFAKGNPPEVALTGEALDEYRRESNRGYMTPEAEIAMSEFLSSEGFNILTTQCRKRIEWYNSPDNPQYHFPLDLTMESMMYIDPNTGRKEFNAEKYQGISTFWHTIDNPLEDNDRQMWHECMDPETHRRVKEAMNRFSDAGRNYNNPL